jgi:hypothetical protein
MGQEALSVAISHFKFDMPVMPDHRMTRRSNEDGTKSAERGPQMRYFQAIIVTASPELAPLAASSCACNFCRPEVEKYYLPTATTVNRGAMCKAISEHLSLEVHFTSAGFRRLLSARKPSLSRFLDNACKPCGTSCRSAALETNQ